MSSDASALFIGIVNGAVDRIEIDSGNRLRLGPAKHLLRITALGCSPDGTQLATIGAEGIVKIRNASSGQLIRRLDSGTSNSDVITALTDVIERNPKHTTYALRGHENGRRRNWKAAADDFRMAAEMAGDSHAASALHSLYHILILATMGDNEAYWRLSEEVLERFSETQSASNALSAAYTGLAFPRRDAEMSKFAHLADTSCELSEDTPGHKWALAVQGLARYRQERFEDAIRILEESRKLDRDSTEPRPGLEGRNLLLIAMCRRKLGQTMQASVQLKQACEMMQEPNPRRPATGEWDWGNWLFFHVQYSEAKELFPDAEWPIEHPLVDAIRQ
jgi:tetratricopeptide (TPR) repeat protein